MEKILVVAGLIVALCGFLILFRFGMPFRVETKGAGAIMLEKADHELIRVERRYKRLGWFGFSLTNIGTGLQTWGVLMA